MKNPMTPAGIEPATFRFVAQHLNHCATAVPRSERVRYYKQMTIRINLLILSFRRVLYVVFFSLGYFPGAQF